MTRDPFLVCGFEAFINGKHIVGQVKEKEQAHKEYREAISKGHGAYLMDEETPVSVVYFILQISLVFFITMYGDGPQFKVPNSHTINNHENISSKSYATNIGNSLLFFNSIVIFYVSHEY